MAVKLEESDTIWLDAGISSGIRVGEFHVTLKEVIVQRVEYVTGFPSLVPETPTAFVIDGSHPKFDIRDKHGNLYSIDALIKNKVSFYPFQYLVHFNFCSGQRFVEGQHGKGRLQSLGHIGPGVLGAARSLFKLMMRNTVDLATILRARKSLWRLSYLALHTQSGA
jgi:hypothetical protein